MATPRILGISDEQTTCDQCGKKNLKCTVALELADGEVVRYGRDCAAAAVLGSKRHMQVVEKHARVAQAIRDLLARGIEPRKVVDVVSARYGYGMEYRDGNIRVMGIGLIPVA